MKNVDKCDSAMSLLALADFHGLVQKIFINLSTFFFCCCLVSPLVDSLQIFIPFNTPGIKALKIYHYGTEAKLEPETVH